ncbi:polyprenyl synthetase family protein [Mycolicibacterium holsaticum]|uniref:polyprenyl synthetase family protein n=1 Tax=Mycolicibacterium holsaticum TaxID=152142 RepID=UPI000A07821F|nr:polyprenyl synthetase family protein [Mycolicibacterium holsaticum]
MSVGDGQTCALASAPLSSASWRADVRDAVSDAVTGFVAERGADQLGKTGVEITGDILLRFLTGGKCLRSTFTYLGWLCGRDEDPAALRAAASMELLHAFALLQDDVMDGSTLRRGHPAAHVAFAGWHRERGMTGSPDRFGESAAVLLGDLCLVWAEQMLRESGVAAAALSRAWPRYDAMRTELAVGQFADLVNDAGGFPSWEQVLDVSRRKSGNYTVRRPLEIGAALAGCGHGVLTALSVYGEAIGEAFQMRDDLLGVFGAPAVTGKPSGVDLSEHKATSVVVSAYHLADPSLRRELAALMCAADLGEADIHRWRRLIAQTGAVESIEQMIDERVCRALQGIQIPHISESVRKALADMAATCTTRAA